MTTATRPRLSKDYLAANTRKRVLEGTAVAIAERGYRCTTVADIVKAARIARNTFYDTFGSKEEAGMALLADAGFESEILGRRLSLDALAVEVIARREPLAEASKVVKVLALAQLPELVLPDDDHHQQTLPPGRHGLPAEFIERNQLERLYSGLASAVAEKGWPVTIQDVCRRAHLSRRTFYEHAPLGLERLVEMMLVAKLPDRTIEQLEDVSRIDCASGLGAVSLEIVSELLTSGQSNVANAAAALLAEIAAAGV